jgi:hypothetical protein
MGDGVECELSSKEVLKKRKKMLSHPPFAANPSKEEDKSGVS